MAKKKREPPKPKTLADLGTSAEPIIFRDFGDENGDIVYALGFRIFINGVDISRHVLAGSISFSFEPRGSENQLSFELDNNNGKFEIRPANIGLDPRQFSLYSKKQSDQSFADSDSYATSSPWEITKMFPTGNAQYIASEQAHARGLTTFSENEKKKLYLGKLKQRADLVSSTTDNVKMRLTSRTNPDTGCVGEEQDDLCLYEGLFSIKAPVINVNDQVRMFIPDPNRDTASKLETLWIPVFTGFVISAPPEHDFGSGQSTISISCSDIRTQLKRKRVLVNATSADQITPNIGQNSGLFQDLKVVNNNTSNGFADPSFTFEKLMAFVLTGHRLEGESTLKQMCCSDEDSLVGPPSHYTMAQSTQLSDNKQGFGQIWFGHYFEYDVSKFQNNEKARAAFLNKWNRLCTFGPTQKYLTWDGMQMMGQGTVRGGDFDAYKVFVHFLVPTAGGQITNLLDRTFLDQMGVQREYMNVQEIIDQVCERIDYQTTVTGAGDIVFEFPMYDFVPTDMGEEFKAVCAVSDSVKNHSINDESNSNPVTGLKVVGGYTDQMNSAGPANEQVHSIMYTVYIVHELLAHRYGPIIEDYSIPFISNGPTQKVDDDTYRRQITVFGVIEFLKRLSEMSSMSIACFFNPFMRPNRPYYYNYGRRLAISEGCSNTLALFSNADTTVNTRYVRRVDDLTGEFIAFSGTKSVPLKYSDKNSLDVWSSEVRYGEFLNSLYDAGINTLVGDNNPVVDADGTAKPGGGGLKSQSRVPADSRVCSWGQAEVEALDRLCKNMGAKRADVLAVLAFESGLNHNASNTHRGTDGKGHPTYATGLNQMMPVSIIDTLRNSPDLIAQPQYAGAATLLDDKWVKHYRDKDGNAKVYVPDELKPQFQEEYLRYFGTPAAQLDMYGAYLANARRSSKCPKDFKFDSMEKLTCAQLAPGYLKKSDYVMSEKDKNMNPGLTSSNQYASKIRSRFGDQANAWATSPCLGSGKALPTGKQETKPANTAGGAGNTPALPTAPGAATTAMNNMFGLNYGSPKSDTTAQPSMLRKK